MKCMNFRKLNRLEDRIKELEEENETLKHNIATNEYIDRKEQWEVFTKWDSELIDAIYKIKDHLKENYVKGINTQKPLQVARAVIDILREQKEKIEKLEKREEKIKREISRLKQAFSAVGIDEEKSHEHTLQYGEDFMNMIKLFNAIRENHELLLRFEYYLSEIARNLPDEEY